MPPTFPESRHARLEVDAGCLAIRTAFAVNPEKNGTRADLQLGSSLFLALNIAIAQYLRRSVAIVFAGFLQVPMAPGL
jgi:hypothetical protein